MIERIGTGKKISVIVVVIGVLIAALALVLANREGGEASPGELPSMTLVYEVYGPEVSVGGDRVAPSYKEVRRLEYRSKTDWIETVIESPSINLGRYGSGSNVGSYRKLDGAVITEYDPLDGSTRESAVADDAIFAPNSAFAFAYMSTSPLGDIPGVAVTTDARVCFNDHCEGNADGIKYSAYGITLVVLEGDNWTLVVLEGDNWIIPVEFGDGFSLRSADIQAPRP